MIKFHNTMGTVSMTNDYFAGLVNTAAQSCYGVVAITASSPADSIKSLVLGDDFPEKGVRVTSENGRLVIELHIKVSYGLNISAIVKSIPHKVKYVVENATGLPVARIDVAVDDILTD